MNEYVENLYAPNKENFLFVDEVQLCKDLQQAFDRFVMEGGMSGSYLYDSLDDKYNYLNEVFETLIVRDIQQKYKIKNLPLLDMLNG